MYGDDRPGKTIWTTQALLEAQEELGWRDLRMLPRPEREEEVQSEEGETVAIRLNKLTSFLKSPLQATAKTALKIYDDSDDGMGQEREIFEFDNLLSYSLFHNTFFELLTGEGDILDQESIEDTVEHILEEGFRPGDIPQGIFLEGPKKSAIENLKTTGQNLMSDEKSRNYVKKFGVDGIDSIAPLKFRGKPTGDEIEAPVITAEFRNMGHKKIRIVGDTPLYSRGDSIFVVGVTDERPKAKDFFSSYISHLVLSACGGQFENSERLVYGVGHNDWKDGPTKRGSLGVRLMPVTQRDAKRVLKEISEAILSGDGAELFPLEMVEEFSDESEVRVTQGEAWSFALKRDGGWGSFRSKYGPVDNYLEYPPPKDPAKVLRERFRYHEKLGLVEPEGEE